MISFWVFAGVLVVATSGVLLLGFKRQTRDDDGRRDASLAIYKDQLAELSRDVAAGVLAEDEAEAQRTEISRRILTVSREQQGPAFGTIAFPKWAVLVVPMLAGLTYWQVGRYDLQDVPRETRLAMAETNNDWDALVARVELHLEKNPSDVRGWQLLTANYLNMGRYSDAVNAMGRIIALSGPTAELYASIGEAMVFANKGLTSPSAIDAITAALKLDPAHPKARYYNALAMAQGGQKEEARNAFQKLLASAPADAPWRQAVEGQLAELAPSAAAPQISADQMQGAESMTPEDRQAMILSMVNGLDDKLKANPGDVEGWLRLIRARTVLNQNDKALAAVAAARLAFASDAAKRSSIDALAQELNLK